MRKCRDGKNIRIGLLAFLFLIALMLGGCSPTETKVAGEKPVKEKKLQIGLSFDSFVIERWLRDRDVFVSTAESLGAEVNVQNANGDVSQQISQIEYFIEKKMDVIAIIAIDDMALGEVVQKAKNAGIKIICYDRLIKTAGCDLYISFDNEKVGTLMGEALRESLPGGGQIFAIYGSQSDYNVTQVKNGLSRALQGSGIEIIYSTFCDNWLAELAFDAVSEGLAEFGTIDGVMCGNDDLAGQAIRALAEKRLAGRIPVVAQDAELSACQRIVEGTQYMTVFKSVDELARNAAMLAVALGNGEDITSEKSTLPVTETINDGKNDVPYYRIDPVPVTAENMDEVIINSNFHRRDEVYLNIVEHETQSETQDTGVIW